MLKSFYLFTEGIIGADQLFYLTKQSFEQISDADQFDLFKNIVLSREINRRKLSWFCKNLQEFAQKDIHRIDQSYSILPQDFLMVECAGRDKVS